MAKSEKAPAAKKTAPKKAAAKKTTAPKKSSSISIEEAAALALEKLKSFDLDSQLQADLEWCLGSFKFDKNPVGLYEMVERSVTVLSLAKDAKVKGVTSKVITEISAALK